VLLYRFYSQVFLIFLFNLSRINYKFNLIIGGFSNLDFFLKKNITIYNNYYYSAFLFFVSYDFIFLKKFFFIKHMYINMCKNFFNSFLNMVSLGYRFLTFDISFNFLNVLIYDLDLLVKYNCFFNLNLKNLKNQQFLFFFKRFFEKLNIKFVIIFDVEYFINLLKIFNLFNLYTYSFVKLTYSALYLDFFIFKINDFFVLQKILFYSTFYRLYNLIISNNLKNYKSTFFKILINN
jgi:hypothetical protein